MSTEKRKEKKKKKAKKDKDATQSLPLTSRLGFFQILSVQQLYRICVLYKDDNYNTRSVSPDVSLFVGISSVMFLVYLGAPFESSLMFVTLDLLKWIWLLSNLTLTLSTGHLQHEGTYDRGLQWCWEQFLLVGWQFWVRVSYLFTLWDSKNSRSIKWLQKLPWHSCLELDNLEI